VDCMPWPAQPWKGESHLGQLTADEVLLVQVLQVALRGPVPRPRAGQVCLGVAGRPRPAPHFLQSRVLWFDRRLSRWLLSQNLSKVRQAKLDCAVYNQCTAQSSGTFWARATMDCSSKGYTKLVRALCPLMATAAAS
jgi:hypothetical protein